MGRIFKFAGFALFGFSLGVARWFLAIHNVTPDQIDAYNGKTMEVTGIVRVVDVRRDQVKYTISAEGELEGKVLITLAKYPRYKYGDLLEIYGELQAPGSFDGFNYGNYLSRYDIYSVMYQPGVRLLESGQ